MQFLHSLVCFLNWSFFARRQVSEVKVGFDPRTLLLTTKIFSFFNWNLTKQVPMDQILLPITHHDRANSISHQNPISPNNKIHVYIKVLNLGPYWYTSSISDQYVLVVPRLTYTDTSVVLDRYVSPVPGSMNWFPKPWLVYIYTYASSQYWHHGSNIFLYYLSIFNMWKKR